MSDKMNKLKEVAGENELDKDQLDLIAGGNVAQTEELWNFYMNHGAEGFLKKYKNNHAKGVLEALKKDAEGISSISNATSKEGDNIYKIYRTNNPTLYLNHKGMTDYLQNIYENGNGFFGQAK